MTKKAIRSECLTNPSLGFEAINQEWIDDSVISKIYLFTDGRIGWVDIEVSQSKNLKTDLANSISKLFKAHKNIHLHVIAVEPKNIDLSDAESARKAAGSDVFNVISERNLTSFVSSFTSYTLNNLDGFSHIKRTIAPPGFAAFGTKIFSVNYTSLFMEYLAGEINKNNTEDQLVTILQNLCATISALVKDRPMYMRNCIVKTFADMFKDTVIDPTFCNFILTSGVVGEMNGQAANISDLRARLKNLYKEADKMLKESVASAINLGPTFVGYPIAGTIVSGPSSLVKDCTSINKIEYPNSCVSIASRSSNVVVPIFQAVQNVRSVSAQCLRQWTRYVFSKLYGHNFSSDDIIYKVLAIAVKVLKSPNVPESVKASYKNLALCMLGKIRSNSSQTELEFFEAGNLPCPNDGNMSNFIKFMSAANDVWGTNFSTMTAWYIICQALDENLALAQLIHCKNDLMKDFADLQNYSHIYSTLSITPYKYAEIPLEASLDYECIITLDDVSNVGGYHFRPHRTSTGQTCSLAYVISASGHEQLFKGTNVCVCPIYFTQLGRESFETVGPKVQVELDIFTEGTTSPFNKLKTYNAPEQSYAVSIQPVAESSSGAMAASSSTQISVSTQDEKRYLITMRGTVGAGKSTFSEIIKKQVEAAGGVCCVEGMDKYFNQGMDSSSGESVIKSNFSKLATFFSSLKVVVIDVCNERDTDPKNMRYFGYDFAGWTKIVCTPNCNKQNLPGYFAWTLRNVLNRKLEGGQTATDVNWCLGPDRAGISVCLNVHKKKAVALFKVNAKSFPNYSASSVAGILELLKVHADAYATTLEDPEVSVSKLLQGLF